MKETAGDVYHWKVLLRGHKFDSTKRDYGTSKQTWHGSNGTGSSFFSLQLHVDEFDF